MAAVLLMILVFCPLVLAESGDDDLPDRDLTCWSVLTFKQSNLTCALDDEPTEEVKSATLCSTTKHVCTTASLGQQYISFGNLNALMTYNLTVQIGDGYIQKQIKLPTVVKIPAPEIKLATYLENTDEVFIWIEQRHDYVANYNFQVEIWMEELPNKPLSFNVDYGNISISRDSVGKDGVYFTRVRAKPATKFFDGSWTRWTSNASFTIKRKLQDPTMQQMPSIIITFIVTSLLLIIGLGALRWKTQIKGYITPNIPHPKATLAQMHRAKEGLPFTFSPEIFSDVFIHRVDYVDEKPGLQDALDERRYSQSSCSSGSVSEMDMKTDEQLPREQSHLKIRLLDEPDLTKEAENCVCRDIPAPQRERKDEAYVTMSSLFKKQ